VPDLTLPVILVLVALACAGTVVQGGVGFGLGVVSSPVIAWLWPELLPVALLVAGASVPGMTLSHEWRHVDWPALGWVLGGRLPATVLGALIVAAVPVRTLQLLVAVAVLLAVGLSLGRWRIPRNPGTLLGAGFVAGLTGTTSGVGGPPAAIVMQRDEPATVRATLAAVFVVGSLVSIGSLAVAGVVRWPAVLAGLAMIPGTVAGFRVAVLLRPRLDAARFRMAVLALSAFTGAALLVASL